MHEVFLFGITVLALRSKTNTRNDSCSSISVVVRQRVLCENEFSRKQNKKWCTFCSCKC